MKYYWIVITIPLLALIIYILTKGIFRKERVKGMTGLSICSIAFGLFLIAFSFFKKPIDNLYILFGICWVLLGFGRLIYDYKKGK